MEQRKKGYKPPFFKNNSQWKPTQNEHKILEMLGKGQGTNLLDFRVVRVITCANISFIDEKE
jgi:hypothetical protein